MCDPLFGRNPALRRRDGLRNSCGLCSFTGRDGDAHQAAVGHSRTELDPDVWRRAESCGAGSPWWPVPATHVAIAYAPEIKRPSGPWLAFGPLMITTAMRQIIWISFEKVKEEEDLGVCISSRFSLVGFFLTVLGAV